MTGSKLIVSVEEHNIIGGLGSAIAEYKSSLKQSPKQLFLGIKDTYGKGGNYKFLKEKHRLTSDKIVEDIEKDGYEFTPLKMTYQSLEEMEKWKAKDWANSWKGDLPINNFNDKSIICYTWFSWI